MLGSKSNYGVGVMFLSSSEVESRSYYTKKFFSRSSEFVLKRPHLEARWESGEKDNRGNFIYSSSLATADENLNTLYLYNYFRGQLRNIPEVNADGDVSTVYVSLFSGSADDTEPHGTSLELVADGTHVGRAHETDPTIGRVVTGSRVSTGIYKARVALTSSLVSLDTVYDVWFKGGATIADASAASVQFNTSSFTPKKEGAYEIRPSDEYVTNVTNLRPVYRNDEVSRFRVYTRKRDWSPTMYTVASSRVENSPVESGSYSIFRVVDDFVVVPHGTGSDLHTVMSYDMSGNYFNFDMSILEPGYMYGIRFAYYNNSIGSWVDQKQVFKFRVEK